MLMPASACGVERMFDCGRTALMRKRLGGWAEEVCAEVLSALWLEQGHIFETGA